MERIYQDLETRIWLNAFESTMLTQFQVVFGFQSPLFRTQVRYFNVPFAATMVCPYMRMWVLAREVLLKWLETYKKSPSHIPCKLYLAHEGELPDPCLQTTFVWCQSWLLVKCHPVFSIKPLIFFSLEYFPVSVWPVFCFWPQSLSFDFVPDYLLNAAIT